MVTNPQGMDLVRSMMNSEPEETLLSTILMVFLWYMLGNKRDKSLIVNNCYSNNTLMNAQDLLNKEFFCISSCCCCLLMDAEILNTAVVT